LPSRLDFSICPNVTTTTYLQTPAQGVPGCGPGISTPNNLFIQPDNTCTMPTTNTDLGTFLTTQNPLGATVHAGAPNTCATSPPTRGPGADGAALIVTVRQTGFCPATLTIAAREGPIGGVVFPIGTLPPGTYNVTVGLPDQTVIDNGQVVTWLGIEASGTLRVGTKFTETDTHTLARPGNTFAVLLDNSFAGPGAGELVSTKTGNVAQLRGTDYYACGTLNVAATVTYGKRGSNGVVRLRGSGSLVGGTGNYTNIKGAFTLRGSYNTRTNRGTFVLRGEATF
jgi:hypothetical protein